MAWAWQPFGFSQIARLKREIQSPLKPRSQGRPCARFEAPHKRIKFGAAATGTRQMIKTLRLILRPWRKSDLPSFAEQNADPIGMRFLGGILTSEQSDAYVERAEKRLAEAGYCKWAVEAPGVSPFIGAVGLTRVKFKASFTSAVEVAWRLGRRYWGQGYVTEAAAPAPRASSKHWPYGSCSGTGATSASLARSRQGS